MIDLREVGTLSTIDLDDLDDLGPDGKPTNINHTRVVFDYEREEGGHCVLYGLRMQLDAGSLSLSTLLNKHIRVTANLVDADGAMATSSKTIVVTGIVN
jgi:hypothetical protein